MRLVSFSARNYRSIRSIAVPVDDLSVFVGANGVGKTNLYRCLELVQAAARGTLALELAGEGGMGSVFWAGPTRSRGPAQLLLQASLERVEGRKTAKVDYEVAVGFRHPTAAAFALEPQIKRETLTLDAGGRRVMLLDRENALVSARDAEGRIHRVDLDLLASETALSRLDDPVQYGLAFAVRRTLLDWRFYHGFRTDRNGPVRAPNLPVASPTLAADGSNLAAVFATLAHIREDISDVQTAVEHAFPGARLEVPEPGESATFGVTFAEHPRRTFGVQELSDGTLQYLALAGALLAYRLPALIALNEPESSLHPDLLEPLATLVARASERSQIWLVTHSERLAAALKATGASIRTVVRQDGGTWISGLSLAGELDA